MGKNKPYKLLENITITDVAAEGVALARVNGKVLFVPGVIPGDVADILVVRSKASFMEGRLQRLVKPSDRRLVPFCSHFGVCGGCKWQMMPYEDQLKYKQQQVIDNLTRIGKVELPLISTIIPSENTIEYRNKLEFTFANRRWLEKENMVEGQTIGNGLGFHVAKCFDKILNIDQCYLQRSPSNQIRNAIRAFTVEHEMPYYDLRGGKGFLRNVIVRTTTTDEVMVIIIFGSTDVEMRNQLLEFVKLSFPAITSLMYVVNLKANDNISDQDVICFSGRDHIIEQMGSLNFKVGPKSFYQTNSLQAARLYAVAKDFADLCGDELVYDLYTGTGTIANYVASSAKRVIGIECVADAIADAKVNALLNGITNTEFLVGDVKDVMTPDFIVKNGRPDVAIVDPPRAGLHIDVVSTLMFCEPKKIVYVSCNPATQARDIQLLSDRFEVTRVQPVDMFPHTHHVENVVLLELI